MLRLIRYQMNSVGEEFLTYLLDIAYLEALERTRSIQRDCNETDFRSGQELSSDYPDV